MMFYCRLCWQQFDSVEQHKRPCAGDIRQLIGSFELRIRAVEPPPVLPFNETIIFDAPKTERPWAKFEREYFLPKRRRKRKTQ